MGHGTYFTRAGDRTYGYFYDLQVHQEKMVGLCLTEIS